MLLIDVNSLSCVLFIMDDNVMNKSRRHFLAGSGALAVGSMLPVSFLTKNAFAAQSELWINARVENFAQMEKLAPSITMPNNSKFFLRQQATDFCKIRLEKNLSPVLKKFIGRTTLGAIVPMFMIFFDLIFPANTPTWDEIKTEIDKRIEAALDKYEFQQIQKDFAALLDAYALRMESVKNNNSGISDESKWDLGHPQEWEPLIYLCLKLKNYFYNNDKFNRHYEASPLVDDFNFMYFIALNARLQCFKEGDDVGTTVGLMAQLLQGQHDYNVKLINIAYNEIHSSKDMALTDFGTTGFGQWRTANTYPLGYANSSSPSLSGYDKWDKIRWTHDMIRERIRLYHLLNTPVIGMCEAQSSAVAHFNSLFGTTIPASNASLNWTLHSNYATEMNRLQKLTPYSDGGGYSGLTLPALRNSYTSSLEDFYVGDAYVHVNGNPYPPGDYISLTDSKNAEKPVYEHVKSVTIPRGLVVIFYSEPNFGEYTDEGSDEVFFKGRSHFKYSDDFSTGSIPDFPVKSMKIRVDTASWFKDIEGGKLGRIPLVKYEKVNGYWTTGAMEMAEKP